MKKPKHYTVQIERDSSLLILDVEADDIYENGVDIRKAWLRVGNKLRNVTKLLWSMEGCRTSLFLGIRQQVTEAVMSQQAEYNYSYLNPSKNI